MARPGEIGDRRHAGLPADGPRELPRGRMARVGTRELVAALHRRRERRREAVAEVSAALAALAAAVERHLARVAELQRAVE